MRKFGNKFYQDFEELKSMIEKSDHNIDLKLVEKAYKLAEEAHKDQRRVSGIPYILHPTSVACILVELGMDTDTIIAALLHDVVEDTEISLDFIKVEFGSTIAALIDGVTKITKMPSFTKEEQQAENVRKMLFAMSQDIRVMIIKLADRLHNMRTIDCMAEQKRRDKARETMEVFAPIAHRLGIRMIKEEMEDLSLKYLDPIGYDEIQNRLDAIESEKGDFLGKVQNKIKQKLNGVIQNFYVEGRVKSINGIYRKTIMQGKQMEQIYDIFAVRVIVDTVNDCYNVLGTIHSLFQPLPNRFKDYISVPKPNNYRSLHTTVIDEDAIPFEIQIRTWDMHHTAELGVAAHWKYKAKISKNDMKYEQRLAWLRQILEEQRDNEDTTSILGTIKTDLSQDNVFVFTPKGDLKTLPAGSTVIDMAYAIHTEVGNRMIGAKVDQKIVPLDFKLHTGEIVEILTAKEGGPKRDWLKIAASSEAKTKIRQWFKKERREENIIEGKNELMREIRRNRLMISESDFPSYVEILLKKQHCNSVDDFYAAIGYGGLQAGNFISRIKEEYMRRQQANKEDEKIISEIPEIRKKSKVSNGVVVEGVEDLLIKFAGCCNPLPGDDIIGYVTRGYGLSIHKRSCVNVPNEIENCPEPERWVKATWDKGIKETFNSTLEILVQNRTGYLADVTAQLSCMHINIQALSCRENERGESCVSLTVNVNDMQHLQSVINRISKIKSTISIRRI